MLFRSTNHHPGGLPYNKNLNDIKELGFNSFLLGVYDKETDKYVTTCVTHFKFTEEQLQKLNDVLFPKILEEKPENVHSLIIPDVWFTPECALSVKIKKTESSREHTAGRSYGQIKPDQSQMQYFIDRYSNSKKTLDMIERENGVEITELEYNNKFYENISSEKILSASKLLKIFKKDYQK